MYPRTEYEMSEDDFNELIAACKPTPAMMIGGTVGPSPQENANRAWQRLGERMGFDYTTVRPIHGKGQRFFSAVPSETAEAKKEREARELDAARAAEIERLSKEIDKRQQRISALKAESNREEATDA